MPISGKLISKLPINAPAPEFYKIFKDKVSHVPNISPHIQHVEVHDGDWENHGHGSIKIWRYTVDGKTEVFKERVHFDDHKLSVTLIGLEGDVFKHYKTFKVTYKVVPNGPKHSVVTLIVEYEKLDDDYPFPYAYLDLGIKITKDIECHLKD